MYISSCGCISARCISVCAHTDAEEPRHFGNSSISLPKTTRRVACIFKEHLAVHLTSHGARNAVSGPSSTPTQSVRTFKEQSVGVLHSVRLRYRFEQCYASMPFEKEAQRVLLRRARQSKLTESKRIHAGHACIPAERNEYLRNRSERNLSRS